MKPLYWTRIQVPLSIPENKVISPEETGEEVKQNEADTSPSSCLWEKIDEDVEVKQSFISRFAEIFSRQPIMRKEKEKKESPKKGKQVTDTLVFCVSHFPYAIISFSCYELVPQVASIVDDKRAHNLNILITSLRLEIAEIESAVYTLDTTSVSTDVLIKINEAVATEEEMKKITKHLQSKASRDIPLGKPEQFLYDLSQIESFSDRVSCLIFEINITDGISVIETKLNNFKLTCDHLISSDQIPVIFSIILTLGNYMNGGNRERGQADGFGLDILPKLRDVKGKPESRTPTSASLSGPDLHGQVCCSPQYYIVHGGGHPDPDPRAS